MLIKTKILLSTLTLLLFFSNGFWILRFVYVAIDKGVTQTYQEVSFNAQKQSYNALVMWSLLNAKYTAKKDILYLLREHDKTAMITQEKNHIFYKNLDFVFKKNQLVHINYGQ